MHVYNELKKEVESQLQNWYKTDIGKRSLALNLKPIFEVNINLDYFKTIRYVNGEIIVYSTYNFISYLSNLPYIEFFEFYRLDYKFLIEKDGKILELNADNFEELQAFYFIISHSHLYAFYSSIDADMVRKIYNIPKNYLG